MQSWDNQSRNPSRNFARRGQGVSDRSLSEDRSRWADDGGRTRASHRSSYDDNRDNDDFSSYDREGRYDRSERSQYAGSQSQYDRQNAPAWGEDSSPNDESDYRSSYQGFSDRDRAQNRYGYGRDLRSGRRYRAGQDARYSQSEYGRGSTLDNTSVRDYDMTRGSSRDAGYNAGRAPETGFPSSARSWDADTERAPYNYGSSRNDWSYSQGDRYDDSNQFGPHAGKGPKGFKRSDERIKEDISEILTRHSEIDASDIEIEVKDGDVTLNGVVPERSMKHLAEDIVEGCMGVHDITNQLRVKRENESIYGTSSTAKTGSSMKKSAGSMTPGNH